MDRGEMLCNNREIMTELVKQFLSDKPTKKVFGNFRIENSRLVYRCQCQEEKRIEDKKSWDLLMKRVKNGEIKMVLSPRTDDKGEIDFTYRFMVKYQETKEEILAQKFAPKGETPFVLGNSTILRLVGKTVSYGNVVYNRDVTVIQQIIEQNPMIRMVPFSVFTELNLDIDKARVVECGSPELVERRVHDHWVYNEDHERTQQFRMENAHFSGSVLFRVGDTHILVDLDRRELEFGNWNAFAVVLPGPAKSIADAYDILQAQLDLLEEEIKKARKSLPRVRCIAEK
jgi:ferredoxin-like protein FixX